MNATKDADYRFIQHKGDDTYFIVREGHLWHRIGSKTHYRLLQKDFESIMEDIDNGNENIKD